MECLVNRSHSNILVTKVDCIGQAVLLDGRFARMASKPADIANRSAGWIASYRSSISTSFWFTRQYNYCVGQAGLVDDRFARLASKAAGERTGQNKFTHRILVKLPAMIMHSGSSLLWSIIQ